MFNLGLDELLIIGILAAFFLDAKKIAQAFKWIRVTRYRLNNLQYDLEEKVDNYLNMSPDAPGKARIKEIKSQEKADKLPDFMKEASLGTDEASVNNKVSDDQVVDDIAVDDKLTGDKFINDQLGETPENQVKPQPSVGLPTLKITQQQAREMVQYRLNHWDEDDYEMANEGLQEELERLKLLSEAQVVAAYIAMPEEASLASFLEIHLLAGKKLLLPKVNGEELDFYLIENLDQMNQLKKGSFGILEPHEEFCTLYKESPEVFLVPGVAFGEHGERVGHGRGFYDRYLKNHPKAIKVGICFEKQVFNGYISQNSWDVPMDYIVSSHRTIQPTSKESQI